MAVVADPQTCRVARSFGVAMGGWNIVTPTGRVVTMSDGTPLNFRTRDQARAELRHLRDVGRTASTRPTAGELVRGLADLRQRLGVKPKRHAWTCAMMTRGAACDCGSTDGMRHPR